MSRRFFIDMDGVLALFEQASIEEMTTPGFFISRKPVQNVIDMTDRLIEKSGREDIEVYVLSSYLLPVSKAEKIAWNEKYTHIPFENQIYVPYGESKADAFMSIGGIRETDVLLDDFSPNLREWDKYGVGVKLYNGINGTKGTWKGFSIHGNMDPDRMAQQLDGISFMESVRLRLKEKESQDAVLGDVRRGRGR